ncbi:MAG: site-specific integrase [bacterium]|nr:site-specific integrase [bacterium]
MSLADARAKAFEYRATAAGGRDPLADKRRGDVPTFRDAAKKVLDANRARWRSDRTATLWWASLENHALSIIGDMAVDRISQSDVLRCVEPMWATRSETARIATWDEIDFAAREWKIPAERMKAASEHRVPLSDAALDVLDQAKNCHDGSDLVFPSPLKPGRPLSDMTLTKILRYIGLADRATVHGFRASFRTWALEQADAPWAVAEAALAHSLGNSTQQAYIRGDAYTKRRQLMDQWAEYLEVK